MLGVRDASGELEAVPGAEMSGLAIDGFVPEGHFARTGAEVFSMGAGGSTIALTWHLSQAVRGADLVTTDVWTSMGFEAENEARKKAFEHWCVDAEMMAAAGAQALFMHCLPAHRGEEVTAEVIDGPQSVVWDEAENRLHAQKALMEYLLLGRVND